jgi:hypothetical protein
VLYKKQCGYLRLEVYLECLVGIWTDSGDVLSACVVYVRRGRRDGSREV